MHTTFPSGRSFETRTATLLSNARSRVPRELFAGVDDDYWLWLNTEGCRRFEELRSLLPGMPPERLQLWVASLVGDETLIEAFRIYRLFKAIIEKHLGPTGDRAGILDFGCGWGRVMRFFLKDIDADKLWGIEMLKEQVNHAKSSNPWCTFLHVAKEPPSSLPADTFDVVIAYSVFSHLSESSHRAWLAEFSRVMKPGGIVIATTWGRERADFLDAVSKGTLSVWDEHFNRTVREQFRGKEQWFSDYDNGRYCHIDLGYAGNEDYGDTSISAAYVHAEWGSSFRLLDYINDRAVCVQDVIIAQRVPDQLSIEANPNHAKAGRKVQRGVG